MIESGNYDQALKYGADKLRGKKNKQTKYVKAFEKAYAKLNARNIQEIRHLKQTANKNSLDRVVNIYELMESRQTYVSPLIPLISEDGYTANIQMKDYTKVIYDAKVEASDIHFNTASQYLSIAKKDSDKITARKAYNLFTDANIYFDNYRNNYTLKQEAYRLGQTHILIEPYTTGSNQAFYHTGDIISQLQLSNINTKWRKYYTAEYDGPLDYIATIEVNEIVPGKEIERYSSFTNTKEVVEGKKPLKNRKGKIVRDSLGAIVYEDKKVSVTANIEEIIREKSSQMTGKIVIIEAATNRYMNTIPIHVSYLFEDYSSIFMGDKRALTTEYNNRIKTYCAPFPTDYEMTTNLAYEYKNAAEAIIKNEKFI